MIRVVISIIILVLCIGITINYRNVDRQNTVIQFSSWGSKSEADIIRKLLKDFEANNPKIKVKFIHIPQNYFQKLHLLFASGLEPDVIFLNNQNISMYINAGLLEELDNYFNNVNEIFYSEAVNCFKNKGKIYAIPRDISNLVIYYNKDIFRKKNISMPSKIRDIYELRKLAKRLTTKEHFGINFEVSPLYWLYYLSSNGGGIISDDGKKIIINSEQSIKALKLYEEMRNDENSMPRLSQQGSMTSAQMFIEGKLAMYLSGRWMCPKFRETIKFDWDVIEFPSPNPVYIDASGYAISKKSRHKKESILLIKYLTDRTSVEQLSSSGLIVPANKNVELQTKEKLPKNYKAFTSMLNSAKPTPVNENYSNITDYIIERLEPFFNGKKDIESALNESTIKHLEVMLDK